MLTGTLLGRIALSVRQSAVCSSRYCPRSSQLFSSSSAVRASDSDSDHNDRKEPTEGDGKPNAESPTTIESILDSLFSNVQTHVPPTASPSSHARTRDTNEPRDARHRSQSSKVASSSSASTDAADLFDSLFGDHGGPRGDGSALSGEGGEHSTAELNAGSVFADLLGTNDEEQPSLQYFSLYPPVVRRWVMDGRIPPGRYQGMGQWSPAPSQVATASVVLFAFRLVSRGIRSDQTSSRKRRTSENKKHTSCS